MLYNVHINANFINVIILVIYHCVCLQEWDEELAAFAKEMAALCHTDAAPEHLSSLRHIGWNMQFSAQGDTSFSDTIDSWFAEGENFSYLTGQCRENTTCQHYTQVYTSILNNYLIQLNVNQKLEVNLKSAVGNVKCF